MAEALTAGPLGNEDCQVHSTACLNVVDMILFGLVWITFRRINLARVVNVGLSMQNIPSLLASYQSPRIIEYMACSHLSVLPRGVSEGYS